MANALLDIRKWQKGQTGRGAASGGLDERTTTPPKPYDEAMLLRDMETAAKFIPDPAMREAMKFADGMGTPATRASIIEKLKKKHDDGTQFIQEVKGALRATTYADKVVAALESCDAAIRGMADPALTALWESELKRIENGEVAFASFMAKQETFIRQIVEAGDSMVAGLAPKEAAKTAPCSAIGCTKGGTLSWVKGKFGFFWSCSTREEGCQCKIDDDNGKPKMREQGEQVPCSAIGCIDGGTLTRREGQYGRYWSCSKYSKDGKGCTCRIADDNGKPVVRQPAPASDVPPLPGHGSKCPDCKKATLTTRKVTREDSKVVGQRFLSCTNRGCKYMKGEWTFKEGELA